MLFRSQQFNTNGYYPNGGIFNSGTKVFFITLSQNWNWMLYASDGSSAGTNAINPATMNGNPNVGNLTVFSGYALFQANDTNGQQNIWTSDGTNNGTNIIKSQSSLNTSYSSGSTGYFMANVLITDGNGNSNWQWRLF